MPQFLYSLIKSLLWKVDPLLRAKDRCSCTYSDVLRGSQLLKLTAPILFVKQPVQFHNNGNIKAQFHGNPMWPMNSPHKFVYKGGNIFHVITARSALLRTLVTDLVLFCVNFFYLKSAAHGVFSGKSNVWITWIFTLFYIVFRNDTSEIMNASGGDIYLNSCKNVRVILSFCKYMF